MALNSVAPYSAGLFDGEGNIHIGEVRGRDFRLQVQVTNTNRAILAWLQRQWGGGIYEMTNRKTNWNQCWNWSLGDREEQMRFLEAIRPYLIIKRHAAGIAIRFLQAHLPSPGIPVPSAALQRRRAAFLELRGLPREAHESPMVIQDDQLALELADFGA